jgi:hypothetical protein
MSTLVKLGTALLSCLCAAGACAQPAQPTLTVTAGAITNHFTAAELLSRPDLVSIQIPPGVDYDVQLTVQAVPLLDFARDLPARRLRPARGDCHRWLRRADSLGVDRGRQERGFGRLGRRRGPSSCLAKDAGERHQCRPILFSLAVSRTIPGGERAMAVYAGKAHSGAVSRSSLAAA